MAETNEKTQAFRLVRVMGRRPWYVRYINPKSGKSVVKSTGETDRAAAEQWLEKFKSDTATGNDTSPDDDRYQALVHAWDMADEEARGRFILKLLTPIIGRK